MVRSFDDYYWCERDAVARALPLTLRDTDLAGEAADEAMARAYQRWARQPLRQPGLLGLPSASTGPCPSGACAGARWPPPPLPMPTDPPTRPDPRAHVAAAIAALDVRQRAVAVCRFYLGMSEQETPDALGIRPATTKSRRRRATRHLATRLDHLRPEELR